jgi:hypothetical protein
MIDAFEAQAVANILHIIAKTRNSPWDQSLVPKLEGQAEAGSGAGAIGQARGSKLAACGPSAAQGNANGNG